MLEVPYEGLLDRLRLGKSSLVTELLKAAVHLRIKPYVEISHFYFRSVHVFPNLKTHDIISWSGNNPPAEMPGVLIH